MRAAPHAAGAALAHVLRTALLRHAVRGGTRFGTAGRRRQLRTLHRAWRRQSALFGAFRTQLRRPPDFACAARAERVPRAQHDGLGPRPQPDVPLRPGHRGERRGVRRQQPRVCGRVFALVDRRDVQPRGQRARPSLCRAPCVKRLLSASYSKPTKPQSLGLHTNYKSLRQRVAPRPRRAGARYVRSRLVCACLVWPASRSRH